MSKRDFTLSKREEGTREKKVIKVVDFHLDEIFNQFNENITGIRSKFNIADKLLQEHDEESCNDIWRSQIVFLDSALDYYIHCITKYGMNKIFNGEWDKTDKYKKFMIPLEKVEFALKNTENKIWFIELINKSYANDTFMDASSVKSQLNLIDIDFNEIANDVFYEKDSTQKTFEKLKEFLNSLFNRRNSIAHQSDRLHENGVRKKINKDEVKYFIDNVEKVVISIQKSIENKNSKE